MAFGVGWMIPLLGMVYVLQIGAIPNAPYCGGLDEGKSVKTIINKPDFGSSENAFVDLSPKEEVIIEFTVERIDGRRLSNCDDDIVFQPVDPVDGDDCNESPSQSPVKFNNDAEGEDDDFVVGEDDQNIGKDSHALTFYVKDKRYDVIHSVLVERTVDIAKFQRFLRVRGQRGSTCGHPTLVEATNVEGTGKVIVNVKKFSHQSNWNKAEVSFDNAKDTMIPLYRNLHVLDLTRLPLSTLSSKSYDGLICVGVLAYLPKNSREVLQEFCRLVISGGIVVFSQRTDLFVERKFERILQELEHPEKEENKDATEERKWITNIQISDPCPYLPGNEEFGTNITVQYVSFQVV